MGSFPTKQIAETKLAISISVKSFSEDNEIGGYISMREKVHHFLPAAFPLQCTIKNFHIDKLKYSWKIVRSEGALGQKENDDGQSAIVVFYDEFYNRLFSKSAVFREHFPGLKMRGGILNRIIHFVCSIDVLKLKETERKLTVLGDNHNTLNVHPWMYGVFAETLVETVLQCLGEEASFEYYQSWTVALSFCLKNMLHQALKSKMKINQREMYNEIFNLQKRANPEFSLTSKSSSRFHSVFPTEARNRGFAQPESYSEPEFSR